MSCISTEVEPETNMNSCHLVEWAVLDVPTLPSVNHWWSSVNSVNFMAS